MAKCNYSIYKRVICSKYVCELKNISFIVIGYKNNNNDYFKCETTWNCTVFQRLICCVIHRQAVQNDAICNKLYTNDGLKERL